MTTVKIRIAPLHQVRDQMIAVVKGELTVNPDDAKISFPSLQAVVNVLSEEHIAILRNIRTQNPMTVAYLAKHLGRDLPVLKRQLEILSNFGFVRLEQVTGTTELRPVLVADEIQINMSI